MENQEYLAMLDRFIISHNDSLEKGEILLVEVEDGYIHIERKYSNEHKEKRTSVYFTEIDGKLEIPFKNLLVKKGS